MNRFFRRLTVIFIIIGLLICSITGVFAVTRTFANDEIIFELGAVIVSLESNSPSVESLLPGFNIAESRLITPGSSTQKVYHVKFVEKSEDIVWRAIEVLNASPYVKVAEPNYLMEIDPDNPTTPVILGDADGDGVLSIVDATCIQRYLAGLITESDINLTSAKVAGNSTVTILDATTIQRKLAGLPIS